MRVLMLNYEYPPLGGGAANATQQILAALAEDDGLHIDLVSSSTGATSIEEIAPQQRIHFLDIGKDGNLHYQSNRDLLAYAWRAYGYARKLMAGNDYDVCHAFFGIPCGALAWRLGLPYIVSLRGSDVPFYNERFRVPDTLLFQRLSRRVWKKSGAVVANSEGLRKLALESAPRQPISVIPNGVDTTLFQPGILPETPLRILIVARLIQRKGIGYLIEAVRRLASDKVELTIAGDGKQRVELEAQVEAAELCGSVRFLGVVAHDDLPAVYQSHHVFVLPSLNEGMSNTVLEAMATGLPVLMTDTGGAAEMVASGKNGYLLEARSADSIVAALEHYIDEPALIGRHGARSRVKAESMSWQTVAAAYRACYTNVAGKL